jgi:competence protein ComEC
MATTSDQTNPARSPFRGFLPFFWLALACTGGILLEDIISLPAWVWGSAFGLSLVLWLASISLPKSWIFTHRLIALTRSDHRLPIVIVLAISFLGGWRHASIQPENSPFHIGYYNERGTVEMVVRVIEPPDLHDRQTNLTVKVESLVSLNGKEIPIDGSAVNGKVLVQVQPWQGYAYGDRLQVTGDLQTPFESLEFSYQDYLARKGIYSIIPYARVDILESDQGSNLLAKIYLIADRGYTTVQSLFPSPESDLLAGILLGRDHGISEELQEAFRVTGTTHIIAISGFNMAVLAGLFSGIFTRILGRRWGVFTAVIGIVLYTILVGGSAAVVRAAIMGCLGVLGGMFGRRQNGLNSLGLAAFGMMLFNPNVLWDIGFQLSIAATLGLVLYAQPLEEWFVRLAERRMSQEKAQKIVGPVSEFFLFSMAAQVMTMPIIAYHFGNFSWLALLANPLILPPQSLVMILGGLTLLAGLILPGLGQVIVPIALPFVTYTIRMVEGVAKLPGGDLVLPDFHFLWVFIFYGVLFAVTLIPKEQRLNLFKKVLSFEFELLILTAGVFLIWNRALAVPDENLYVTLLDSEGTVLIQTPGKKAVLIGGGASPSHLKHMLGQFLPPGGHQLDVVIVGSNMRDDLNALSGGLKNMPESLVLWCGDPEVNQISAEVHYGFGNEGLPIIELEVGQKLALGEGVELEVMWVGERGSVFWLNWGNFSTLLPAGKVENHWLEAPALPEVVLLPDGIRAADFPLEQINSWSPSLILLPLNSADLPLEGEHDLVSLLEGYPILTTFEHDWVRIKTDGDQMWVYGE